MKINSRANRVGRKGSLCAFLLLSSFVIYAIFPGPSPCGAASPQFEIKLATLAPDNSSLMQIFNEMNDDLLKETEGKVGFKMFSGFVLGDEEDVMRKLRVGLVHGAVFTATALTDINPDIRALQIPFLFHDYGEVDHVMEKVDSDLKRKFSEHGYEIMGWPELGFLYFMSTSPIASLDDLRGKKVWAKANMPMSQAMIDRAGVSTVAIGIPDILVALQTNLLDVVYNSPYYALVTQWNTQVKYLTDLPLSYIGGALMIDKRSMAKMPPALQETMKKVCGKHLRRLTEKTRKDNEDALKIIFSRGVEKVTPTAAQIQGFKDLSDKAMNDLSPEFLPRDAVDKVKTSLAEYRAQRRQ